MINFHAAPVGARALTRTCAGPDGAEAPGFAIIPMGKLLPFTLALRRGAEGGQSILKNILDDDLAVLVDAYSVARRKRRASR